MSDTVIRVENLGKKYIISHKKQERYTALRDVLADGAKSIGRRILTPFGKRTPTPKFEEFWALKDVSFEIKQGDRVGIIGRNGAGKSTLLKILSRITEPTTGRISIKGRVASLLEVGTGFHPELTGRENIYLNGAILGMSRVEIKRKFDEIVAFAEVEKFLDTPVKRYSSGMYVRLAFAVAAHLEPEILVVDEVLAVGDAQFQKKCLGKMEEVGKEGRTVLFVSHNMGTITQLCTQALYLLSGKIAHTGNVNSVVSKYLTADGNSGGKIELIQNQNSALNLKKVFFKQISLIDREGVNLSEIDVRDSFYLMLEYKVTKTAKNIELSVRIDTNDGRPVFTTHQSDSCPESCLTRIGGMQKVYIKFPAMFLMPGSYLVTVAAHEPMVEIHDVHEHIIGFNIIETGTKLAKYQHHHNGHEAIGVVIVNLPWLEDWSVIK
jgi:lipopolysaccharide transport system ATP-binding protein